MLLSTTSGSLKLIPSSWTKHWHLFSSALEATEAPSDFPLPLDDEGFDKWCTLCLLIESKAWLEHSYYEKTTERVILLREDYEGVIAYMDQ